MEFFGRQFVLNVLVIFSLHFEVEAKPRVRRSSSVVLWPDGVIPYVIPSSMFTDAQQKMVRVAMNRWEEVTCIKFVPYTDELQKQMGAKRYIDFYQGATCFSSNGMIPKQPQTIGISLGCMDVISIAHEIGHAIGLIHTQGRLDRENYIDVLYENMNPDSNRNFDTVDTLGMEDYTLYGTPYDYKSIMHYKPDTWSKNGLAVIETTDPAYQSIIGRASKISFYDSMWVNKAYHCNDQCDLSKQCLNGGYIGGANCQCICPDGFIGYNCEAPLPGYQKIINWRCPSAWTFANGRCYKIYPDIYIPFTEALNLCNNQDATHVTFETQFQRDWVLKTLAEIKFTNGKTQSIWIGVKRNANDGWIGNEPFYQWLGGQTYNDSLMPIHDMGSNAADNCGSTDGQYLTIGSCLKQTYRGFICMKDFDTACGGRFRLRDEEQYITSPGYPNDYTSSMECQYVIQTSRDRRVEISFEVFSLEISTGCESDYVLVQSTDSALDPGKKFCGRSLNNKTLVSDGTLMIITFKSDIRTADKGFKAKIKAIPLRFGGRDLGNPTNFLGSFYSVFSANNKQPRTNSYLDSAWNIFRSMPLSNILG